MMLDDIQIYRVHMAIAAIAPLPASGTKCSGFSRMHTLSTLRVEDWLPADSILYISYVTYRIYNL